MDFAKEEAAATLKLVKMKLEGENTTLRSALSRLARRVGDEQIDSSDDSSADDIVVGSPKANTRHFQTDNIFASTYYYINNVNFIIYFRVVYSDYLNLAVFNFCTNFSLTAIVYT